MLKMIKGVNRQVVELNDTGNEYFEKAILFVKPEYSGLGEGKLHERAQTIMKSAGNPPKCKAEDKPGQRLAAWLKLAAAGITGALISAIICLLLQKL